MTRKQQWGSFFFLALLAGTPTLAADKQAGSQLDREFKTALTEYNSGNFGAATMQLEKLVREVPESFDVHELLGLVYSAESQDTKATEHLEKAVRLKPGSAAARTNLAANLARLGDSVRAEKEFKKAVELDPRSFDANHNLGELYIRAGDLARGAQFLQQAQRVNPSSYENGYDLSLALLMTGKLDDARAAARALLSQKDTAELHNLLAEIDEKDGKFIAAANEFEAAAHMDPSESNLFDWGSELLLHRTLDPAIEVFKQATERYPKSPRLAIALGVAFYSRGNYDDAVKSLLRAADLNPSDPNCYLFLSRAYDVSPGQADEVAQRFRRFAELQPKNPRALYYYAMSLWKGKRAQDSGLDLQQIEMLLKSATDLDPNLAEAHLQLGNFYSDQKNYARAVPEYLSAIEHKSDLAEAHYRLGQAYVHVGEKDRAQQQFDEYQKLQTQQLAEMDRQKAEIRQFVYSAKDGPSAKQ